MRKALKTAAALGLLIWCASAALPAQALEASSGPIIRTEDGESPSPRPSSSESPRPRPEPSESSSERASQDAEKASERAKHDAEKAAEKADKAAEQASHLKEKFGSDDQLVLPPLVVKKPNSISTPAPTSNSASTGGSTPADTTTTGTASKSGEKYVAVAPGTDLNAVTSNGSAPAAGATETGITKSDIMSDNPIEISGVNPTEQTPADTFMSAASYGLGAMAIGAAALAAMTLLRGSNRGSKSKSEFTYTSSSN